MIIKTEKTNNQPTPFLPKPNPPTVSSQPSDLTLDQTQLLSSLQEQFKLAKLLNEISNQIRSTLDFEQVLNSACQRLGEALQCSRVSILVKESEDDNILITRGEYNIGNYSSQLGIPVPLTGNSHLQALINEPGALAVTRFAEFPGLDAQTLEIVKNLSIVSMLAIATRYQGEVNGIIGIHQCDQEREWTELEKQLLEGVAAQLAIAINQARLYAESRRKAEQESLLRLITNQIQKTLNLSTILQTAVAQVRLLLNSDRVVIYQFQDNWQGQIVVEDLQVSWPSIFSDIIADDCFTEKYADLYLQGRVKAIDNIYQANLDSCHVNFLEKLQVKANLIVPIIMGFDQEVISPKSINPDSSSTHCCSLFPENQSHQKKRLWGLLIAHECHDFRHWQWREIELLQQLAEQLAIAIYQAELYSQVQQTAVKSQEQAEQLEETLKELRTTQIELIQKEKMSSLGELVSGIAHEINNPNNFIYANLSHAQDYVNTLQDVIKKLADVNSESGQVFAKLNEELELDYIEQDFPQLLQSMQQGSERIRSIVLSLRDFANLDKAELKIIDLHLGLESSLAILDHRFKKQIKLVKEYSTLPTIECYPGQLNQAFFHLLNNALDAVSNLDQPEITIRTQPQGDERVRISIRDNGAGILPENQPQIFEPFFTTKPVGKGTGLGLSIAYQVIVNGHKGTIECHSQPGQGTEFIIELPMKMNP